MRLTRCVLCVAAEDFDKNFEAGATWFHTGDIGLWTPSGGLKIVDRLKNLVKLSGGEYIAIEAMEATFAASRFVNNLNGGILVYADPFMDRAVALVQANQPELENWAKKEGIPFGSFEELCATEEAADMVMADMNKLGKGVLGGNENLLGVALLPGTDLDDRATGETARWTPDNAFLTARYSPHHLPSRSVTRL